MNKRAMGDIIIWVINLIVLALVVIFISGATNYVVRNQIDTGNLRTQLIAKKIIYQCLAYQDDFGNVVVGSFAESKITDSNLNSCINKENIGARVSYLGKDYFYNKDYFLEIEPIAFGKSYISYYVNNLIRVVKSDGTVQNAIIKIAVVGKDE